MFILPNPFLLFFTNILLASHLKYPFFQTHGRFIETGIVRTKRNHFFFPEGSHDMHSAAVHARVWTPVGTRLSMSRDGAIKCQANTLRQRQLTEHKYFRNKLSHGDVSSCRLLL